jgi:threonylcarbamoyladenosine tRNA methylthiotransferase MtaB
LDELRYLLTHGYKEIVLAGINIGLYNNDGYDLFDVLEEINDAPGLEAINLCSLEPMSLDKRFIGGLSKISKLRPHFHISLQSGSNRILSLMNRNYTFEQYYGLITDIRANVKEAAISTDVIIGFPGEGGADFNDSCENIVKCRFSDIHIFKYSLRAGTLAADMPGQISAHKKSARAGVLEGIKMQACYDFNSRFIGTTVKAVVLKKRSDILVEGVTEHEIKITAEGPGAAGGGDYVDVLVTGLGKGCGSLKGVPV